jgi:hypothetical protein
MFLRLFSCTGRGYVLTGVKRTFYTWHLQRTAQRNC